MPETADQTFATPTTSKGRDDDLVVRGRYVLPDPVEPDSSKKVTWMRATNFAKAMANNYSLDKWKQRMAIKGVTMRPDLYALVAGTPLDEKDTLDDLAEQAKDVAGARTKAGLGTALHRFLERVDKGDKTTIPAPWAADIAAVQETLAAKGIEIIPEYIERAVVVKRYAVAGTFDRIVRMRDGSLRIADLKTGGIDYAAHEIVIQLALYAMADGIWNRATGSYDPMPDLDQNLGIIIHAPVGEATCTIKDVDLVAGRNAVEIAQAVIAYRKVRNDTLLRDHVEIGVESPADAPAPGLWTWESRIAAASSVEELGVLWAEAAGRNEWSLRLGKLAQVRRTEIAP